MLGMRKNNLYGLRKMVYWEKHGSVVNHLAGSGRVGFSTREQKKLAIEGL